MSSHDETSWIASAGDAVLDRLEGRLQEQLTAADDLAVKTAVVQALIAGYRQGVSAAIFAIETQAQQPGVDVTLNLNLDIEDRDPWAERYEDS